MKIFISLVAYCDNELPKTIENIYATAKNKDDIVVGIVNQDDDNFVYEGTQDVRIINITPEESDGYGACRLLCNTKLYKGEDYYLQIAPHSRLIDGWDEKLINYYNKTSGKRILVSTPSSYDIDTDKKEFFFFIDGVMNFHTHAVFQYNPIKDREALKFDDNGLKETTTFFAGCIFATKEWLDEVKYDSKIFLYGEEGDLSMRTFGMGYTAYLIKEEIVWHLWGRKNRKALGHIREKERYNKRNYDTKKYIFEKLLNKEYPRQDEYFKLHNLTYENLRTTYNSLINKSETEMIKDRKEPIKAIALYNRNYSTAFKTKAGQEYNVPAEIYYKGNNSKSFIIQMKDQAPVEKMKVEMKVDASLEKKPRHFSQRNLKELIELCKEEKIAFTESDTRKMLIEKIKKFRNE